MSATAESRSVQPARLGSLAVMGVSAFMLAFALVSQYGFGLRPCALCYWQRWPYWVTIAIGATAFFLRGWWQRALLLLAAATFLTGAGIAFFHVGVEYGWWQGLAECSGGGTASTLEDLRSQLLGAKPVRCDEPQFVFLGLTMAGWNFLLSLLYAGACLFMAARMKEARA